jgi:hypothetical protein
LKPDNYANDRLAEPLNALERKEQSDTLNLLHRANRFRLMFGQPFLEDDPGLPAFLEARKKAQN